VSQTLHSRASSREEDSSSGSTSLLVLAIFFLLGVLFGILLIKSEAVSWFRIQEMFRFQSFHMYGILASAVLTAALGLQVIRRFGLTTFDGSSITVRRKELGGGRRYAIGGMIFGLGWALTGACPAPILALIGAGATTMLVVLLSALLGTWVYGHLRPSLPH